MKKTYGLPYMGSKNKIANWVVDHLPAATHLYDLFAGGCAVTHAALLSGKYDCVHFSDVNDSVVLFRDCMEGRLPDGSEWISREEFFERKDIDPYIRIVWSFGNNQKDYLYGRHIEEYKKAVYEMVFAPTPYARYLKFKTVYRQLIQENKQGLQSLQPFESFERFERLQRLQELQELSTRHETRISDYREVEILPDSVIYCDIPYRGTKGYLKKFDYPAFYDWCERQHVLTIISEYSMPEERFECIAEISNRTSLNPSAKKIYKTERLWIPKHQTELYKRKMKKLNPTNNDESI